MGLLSATEIWSAGATAPAKSPEAEPLPEAKPLGAKSFEAKPLEARIPEPVAAAPEKAASDLPPQAETTAEIKPRSVRERLVAAIWSTESRTAAPAKSSGTLNSETSNSGTASFNARRSETTSSEATVSVTMTAADTPPPHATADAEAADVKTSDIKAIGIGERATAGIAPAQASEPQLAGIAEIIKVPERATIANVLPQFAAAAEVQAIVADARTAAHNAALDKTAATRHATEAKAWPPRKLSVALQGGGSFAAFSWGVLERLLEQPECSFDVISGASAGAVNAALLASGLASGGREGAHALLGRFWGRMTSEASFRSLMLIGGFSPAGSTVAFGPALRSGQFDPFDLDPLRQALAKDIDFAKLQDPACPKLLVAATRVRDGALQIFRNRDLTADVLLASTCPPQLHCAVDLDGDAYWDGGYGANPPLLRLVQESEASDVLVVQVTPSRDSYIPVTMAAIDRRLDQITANAVLNAEFAALEWARDAASTPALRALRLSRIAAEDEIEGLAQRSPVDLGRNFIGLLHRSGRAAAERWLNHGPDGKPSAPRQPHEDIGAPGIDASEAPRAFEAPPAFEVPPAFAEPELV